MICDWHVSDQTVTRTEMVAEGRDIIFAFIFFTNRWFGHTPSNPVPSNAPSEFRIQ